VVWALGSDARWPMISGAVSTDVLYSPARVVVTGSDAPVLRQNEIASIAV
jgi:hypothetical protein